MSDSRDEKGRFTSGHKGLSSERATELAHKRWEREREGNVDKLLREAGFDPEEAPINLRLLAEKAAQNKTGSVQALQYFDKRVGAGHPSQGQPYPVKWNPSMGPCPTCGKVPLMIDADTAARLVDLLRDEPERNSAPKGSPENHVKHGGRGANRLPKTR
jgi:hypothetical protein